MVVIVDRVTLNKDSDEEDNKSAEGTVMETVEGIERDIRELLRCGLWMVVSYDFWWHYSILGTIYEDLTAISTQNRWVITIYKQPNMIAIHKCINRLSSAMQKFTVCIRTDDTLSLGTKFIISPAC